MRKKRISVIGAGYVGLSTSVGFASKGYQVVAIDQDKQKVGLINKGVPPFYEPGLEELLKKTISEGNLTCTQDIEEPVVKSDITFISVGTPSRKDGDIDLSYLRNCASEIGDSLKKKSNYHLVVVKSTVLPGTTSNVVKPLVEKHSGKRFGQTLGLCMNPEFLVEGAALRDTFNPDRIVIGEYDQKSGSLLQSLYKQFYGARSMPPIIRTNLQNAELIKYASNAFLAMKISYINQIANLCQRIPDADVEIVAKGIGLDQRIGQSFLKAGWGWGGSCFPKDIRALVKFSRSLSTSLSLADCTLLANDLQPLKAISLAEALLGDLAEKRIALLGLSFKPETDDIRGAVSIQIIESLLKRKAKISVYDPAAMKNTRIRFGNKLDYCHSALECIDNADCAIIVTEWSEFSKIKPNDFALRMRTPVLLDGRRCYSPNEFSEKIKYAAVGLGSEKIHLGPDETVWVNPACAVNVVVEDMQKILLVRRALEPFKDLWSLPGGYVEYGETTEDAAKREVKEECGLDIRLQRAVGVYSDPRRHPWKHVVAICYAAKKVQGVIKSELGGEKAKFFAKDDLPRKLAFDHMKMLEDYLSGGRSRAPC